LVDGYQIYKLVDICTAQLVTAKADGYLATFKAGDSVSAVSDSLALDDSSDILTIQPRLNLPDMPEVSSTHTINWLRVILIIYSMLGDVYIALARF
jgi:hypothetical protein